MGQTKLPRAQFELLENCGDAKWKLVGKKWYVEHDGVTYFGSGYDWFQEKKRGVVKRVNQKGMDCLNAFISWKAAEQAGAEPRRR